MQTTSLSAFLQVLQFSTARSLRLLAQIEALLPKYDAPAVVAAIAQGQSVLHEIANAEREYLLQNSGSSASYPQHVHDTDALIDSKLTALERLLQALRAAMGADSITGQACTRLLTAVFPEGVLALIRAPFVEQSARVAQIVALLQGELASDIAHAGVPPQVVAELAQLSAAMQDGLAQTSAQTISYQQLQAHRAAGHRAILRVVVQILARFDGDDAQDVAARAELLGQLVVNSEEVRAARRRRKGAVTPDGEPGEDAVPS